MNLDQFNVLFQIGDTLVTAAVGLYVYLSHKDKVTNHRIGELRKDVDDRLDTHGERLARLEEAVQRSPTHDDLGGVHTRINEVGKGVHTLTGEVKAMHNT